MILKLMGFIDFIAAITLILIPFELASWKLVILSTIYLLFKAYAFKGDFVSILDGLSGLYIFVTYFGFTTVLTPFFTIYLLQKAVFSYI